jgi:RNA-directed DNA polymerase
LKLSAKIGKQGVKDYLILRYRDDYRIFVNNLQDGDKILKCLTEVLITLGLRLNASKTKLTNLVIREAIKPDKFAWMTKKQRGTTLQKHAFLIYGHSLEFPNSGSVSRALNEYYRLRMRYKGNVRDPLPLISIIVDIAYRNPRTYPICAAILSKLLSSVDSKQEKKAVVKKIHKRFSQIPNTGHMEIWLQRITLPYAPEIPFKELLCHLVKGNCVEVWNSDWISSAQLKAALSGELIIDRERAQKIDPVIPLREVSMFMTAPWSYE